MPSLDPTLAQFCGEILHHPAEPHTSALVAANIDSIRAIVDVGNYEPEEFRRLFCDGTVSEYENLDIDLQALLATFVAYSFYLREVLNAPIEYGVWALQADFSLEDPSGGLLSIDAWDKSSFARYINVKREVVAQWLVTPPQPPPGPTMTPGAGTTTPALYQTPRPIRQPAVATPSPSSTSQSTTRSGNKPKTQARKPLPPNITWNGKLGSDWDTFDMGFRGHFSGVGVGYMFDSIFEENWIKGGWRQVKSLGCVKDSELTKEQAMRDGQLVHGGLISALRIANGTQNKHLFKHQDTQDGFGLWYDIHKEGHEDYNIQAQKNKYDNVLMTTWDPRGNDDFITFIDRLENAWAGLDKLRLEHPEQGISEATDIHKKDFVLSKVTNSRDQSLANALMPVHSRYPTTTTYEEYIAEVKRTVSTLHLKGGQRKAGTRIDNRRGQAAQCLEGTDDSAGDPTSTILGDTANEVLAMKAQLNDIHAYLAYQTEFAQTLEDERAAYGAFTLPFEAIPILRSLSLEQADGTPTNFWEAFQAARRKAAATPDKGGDKKKPGIKTTTSRQNDLPRQYTTAQAAKATGEIASTAVAAIAEIKDKMGNVSGINEEEDKTFTDQEQFLSAMAALTAGSREENTNDDGSDNRSACTVSVRSSMNLERLCLALNVDQEELEAHFAANDSAADTTIGGKHAYFFDFSGKKANILGFDTNYAKKKDCLIGSMALKVQLRDGNFAILIFHQAVQNAGSNVTLLSEYQMRENGILVDPTPRHHKTCDNKTYGTQCMWLDPTDSNTKLDLIIQGAITGLKYYQCTQEDFENEDLPHYVMTSPEEWQPQDHYHDGVNSISPLNSAHRSAMAQQVHACDVAAGQPVSNISPTVEPFEEFHDAVSFDPAISFDPDLPESLYYFDPEDRIRDEELSQLEDRYTFKMSTNADDWTTLDEPDREIHINTCWAEPEEVDDVERLLNSQDDRTLLGYDEPFDTYCYGARVAPTMADANKLRRYLAWLPNEVIRKTLEATTQLAMLSNKFPMRRHLSSLFPWLNRKHIDETIATDTIFSNVTNIGGYTCAQVYYGLTSHMINVFGLKTESENDDSLKDFLRQEGIPPIMRSDNAKSEKWGGWLETLRNFLIKAEHSEPHNQQQNPCELRAVKWLKDHAKIMMRRTGAPAIVWFQAIKYLADVHNYTADETLKWCTPKRMRTGVTPDISPFLQFQFMERVYYHESEETFPSTMEKSGYWVGVAWNVGDVLTFQILTDDMETILDRSVVRSAFTHPNKTVEHTAEFGIEPAMDGVVPPPIADDDDLSVNAVADDSEGDAQDSGEFDDLDDDLDIGQEVSFIDINSDPYHPDNLLELGNKPMPANQAVKEHHTARRRIKRQQRGRKTSPVGARRNPKRSTRRARMAAKEKYEDPIPSTIGIPDDFVVTPFGNPMQKLDTEEAIYHLAEIDCPDKLLEDLKSSPVDNLFSNEPEKPPKPKAKPPPAQSGPSKMERRSATNVAKAHSAATQLALDTVNTMHHLLKIIPLAINSFHLNAPAPTKEVPVRISQAGEMLTTIADPTRPDYSYHHSTSAAAKQLDYVLAMDHQNELTEVEDAAWKPCLVSDHKVRKVRHPKDKSKSKRYLTVLVHWFDDEEPSWIDINAIRLSDPLLLLDYARNKGITKSWPGWEFLQDYDDNDKVSDLRQAFKAVVQGESRAPKYEFGVEVPRNVRHALQLDEQNGNHLWRESIEKELKQIQDYKTFRAVKKGESLMDYTRIPYHIIFAVKVDGRRKSRLVANGNCTDPPKEDIYSGVVGIENVRLAFVIGQMNGYSSVACDIGNAYLHAKTSEKVYVLAGKEFGDAEGKPLIIDKGLYGLASSSARFHEHLSAKLKTMGYYPSRADADLWIKRHDNDGHFSYIARYVDDLICTDFDPMKVIYEIKKDYILKGIGVPEFYLGGDVLEMDECWHSQGIFHGLGAETYIRNAVSKYERVLGRTIAKFDAPMEHKYHPESDDSPLLSERDASLYRGLIGSANWMITLGRFDINYATNALSRYSMAPREGHLSAMLRVFGYLKKYFRSKILIDTSYPDHSQYPEVEYNWQEFYPDAEEDIPPDSPEANGQAYGKKARITCYVDSDHAHDVVTRRSVTGVIIFVNNTPVKWISKRQKTVETSSYGSELVAARMAVEAIMDLRYKLRMLGVPLDGPALMLGDNMSVVLNTTVPSSPLKKKHQAVNYHRVREAIAAKIIRFAHIPSDKNLSDVLNKPLPPYKHRALVGPVLFRRPPIAGSPRPDDPMIDDGKDGVIRRLEQAADNENSNLGEDKKKLSLN